MFRVHFHTGHGQSYLLGWRSLQESAYSNMTSKRRDSHGAHMITDIQGIHRVRPGEPDTYVWTDPQIHTHPHSKRFGEGNLGREKGMKSFFKGHRCSVTCNELDLNHPFTQDKQEGHDRDFLHGLAVGQFKTIAFQSLCVTIIAALAPGYVCKPACLFNSCSHSQFRFTRIFSRLTLWN